MAFQPEKALVEFFYQQYALQGSGKLMLGSVTGMLNMLPQYPVRGMAYCALAVCTTQMVYFNDIYLVNTCGVPLEVEPHHYTNWLPPIAPRLVAPGEQVSVASYKSFGEDVDQQVSCRYSLTVKGAQRTRLSSASASATAVDAAGPLKMEFFAHD
ncbi:hypothetical protein [Pseudomonas sp. P9_31]|uniref:hypothetical protein n=1 Tax=Pseudomonas sp. P9_31 TaxID=3043448 RepID=UPI002A369585|nr:hypothetical protein [Pseudomonas sp. P9_31]WPN57827.1 hypothetical protein QMK51_27570 [Pseudomonas sp. P9_31]